MTVLCIYLAIGFFIGGWHYKKLVNDNLLDDEKSDPFPWSIFVSFTWLPLAIMWLGSAAYEFFNEQYGGEE